MGQVDKAKPSEKSDANCIILLQKEKFNPKLIMYFNKRKDYWAIDRDEKCNIGDLVLIQELEERVSPQTRFEVKEVVFKLGAVVDPITQKPCRGTEFIETGRKTGLST